MRIRKSALTTAFAVAMVIFITVGWLTFVNMRAVEESDYWENHTYVVIYDFDALLAGLLDAQSSQRGYLITGDDGYLRPYQSALARIARSRTTLREVTKDNPSQQARLDALDPVVDRKLTELKVTIDAKVRQGPEVAGAMVRAHLARNVMDRIRALIGEAQAEERRLLRERAAKKQADQRRAENALLSGGLVGFLILLTVFYLLDREVAQRSKAEEELLARNAELQNTRDKERAQHWVKSGLNELNSKLRGDRPLAIVAAEALSVVASTLKVGVGALYLLDEQSEELSLAASFALPGGRRLKDTFRVGEGVAGEAAREKRQILLAEVPPDYLVISSGLGEAVPRSLLAVPLLHDERVVGVMELGTFGAFSDREVEFLNAAAESLAIVINVNQTRQRVNELLQQSQSQEEELRVQQEELQQSNEELMERAKLLEQQREQIQAKNREMEEAAREITRKAMQLEQISSYKSQFLANMSHELRTPLNSLMILSGQLMDNKEGNLTPKQVEYASTIKSAGTQLLALINDILDLAKIESGRLEFVYEGVRLSGICREVEGIFRPLAEQKGLSFSTSIEDGVPEEVSLDAQRTLQVLKNLISNALKFTMEGEVALRIYRPERGDHALAVPALGFQVIDTGIGISPEKHELVFQAFQQADGSTSRKFGGTGLGLSISRQLARGMGGDIMLGSEEGRGSVFSLLLPLSPQPDDTARRSQEAGTVPPPPLQGAAAEVTLEDDRNSIAPGGRSILIIEDDETFARLLMDRVRQRGFAALVAGDGKSGIELAETYLPAAILLDVMLPGSDGWAFMQRLTDNMRIRHIPVHFITALEEKQKALGMGALGFVTKPVTSEQLDAVLASIEEAVSRSVKKLLVVEDDKDQASALVALLQEREISITVAASGGEAIGLLRGDHFDCIVLDLGLADMSGFDLLEHIRGLDESRRVPVIVHTGQELSADDARRLHRYAESIIIKGAKSPERLLNEVTLFLHVMESRLPPEKQAMIRNTLDNETLLAGKKVLLVDDDMRNVFSLSGVLVEKGMQVIEAENGKVALARLEEHPDINIVLMDIMMPEMDGYEATRQIRRDPRFSRLPIIALTAKAMKGDREECLKAGASDYISKPVDVERLLSLLRVWLYNEV